MPHKNMLFPGGGKKVTSYEHGEESITGSRLCGLLLPACLCCLIIESDVDFNDSQVGNRQSTTVTVLPLIQQWIPCNWDSWVPL